MWQFAAVLHKDGQSKGAVTGKEVVVSSVLSTSVVLVLTGVVGGAIVTNFATHENVLSSARPHARGSQKVGLQVRVANVLCGRH